MVGGIEDEENIGERRGAKSTTIEEDEDVQDRDSKRKRGR